MRAFVLPFLVSFATTAAAAEPSGVLRLPEALAATLESSPELATFSWELRAREAREIQAGLRPNPALSLEVEDFGGRDELRGFESSQTTLQLSQLIELGGKRAARMRAAQLDRELAAIDYEARRLEVLSVATRAFVDVLAGQERVTVAEEKRALAAELGDAAKRRLRAGGAPAVEVSRAAIAESGAELELSTARQDLEAARLELAASWGGTSAHFERAEGDLERVGDLPSLAALQSALDTSPELRRWSSDRAQSAATLELAQSQATPNVALGPGVRWLAGPDSTAFVLSATVPLPLFDRNQGGIAEAASRVARTAAAEREARVRVTRDLASEYQAVASARASALAHQTQILPESRKALEQVRAGYLNGRFNQLEVIDAQRTLYAARAAYLDAIADYHRGVAALERLIAGPLPEGP